MDNISLQCNKYVTDFNKIVMIVSEQKSQYIMIKNITKKKTNKIFG